MNPQMVRSPDYRDYLERYEFFGQGRPKLSPEEYDRLDDELLELLALQTDVLRLTLEQEERLRELELLLILDETL
jgi:hypothetical protein